MSVVTLLALTFTLTCCEGRRVNRHQEVNTEGAVSCKSAATSCADCLQAQGPCMWCPTELWNHNFSYLSGKRAGVCGKVTDMQDVWCGGEGWSVATSIDDKPYAARSKTEAASYCPTADVPLAEDVVEFPDKKDEWKFGPLATMTGESIMGMHDQNTGKLATLLDRISMDLRRLQIFREVNPLLFEQNFDPDSGNLLKYSWKGAILVFSFVDLGFGGILSSAIALAAGGITDVTEEFVKDMSVSQKRLIEKGGKGNVQYFSDVSYGVLKESYERVLKLPENKIAQFQQSLVKDDGGTIAGHFHQAHSSTGGKVAKFTTQAGLFVGGFFTGGVTWIIGAGLGVADYATAVTAEEVSKNAAKMKLELLLGLARSRGQSAWGEAGETCKITERVGKESPCTPIAPPDSSEKPVPRFCSRGSVWKHHVDAVPEGETSPEGRCLPTRLPQLPDGFPCHAHSNCKSSYCHYEPRLQFFVSDHARKYCESGTAKCYESIVQLSALSKVVPRPSSDQEYNQLQKNLRGFVSKYDSFEGVEFATTGTCATACPLSEIGSDVCSHGGHTGKFGVMKNSILSVAGNDTHFSARFEKIGDGACMNSDGELPIVKEIPGMDSASDCARYCITLGMSAFMVERVDGVSTCKVLRGRPGAAKKTGNAVCYDTELPWPLDAYQPWNSLWRNYRKEIRQILGRLHLDEKNILPKIREAYRSYCIKEDTVDHRGHPILIEGCSHPRDWDANDAEIALMHLAPLSAKQLHTLFTQITNNRTRME